MAVIGAMSRWRTIFRGGLGLAAAGGVVLLLALAVLGPPLFSDKAERVDVPSRLQGAGAEHWFGTDELGRDILARTLATSGLTIGLALLATVLAVTLGLLLGLLPVMTSGRLRRSLVGAMEVALAFPWLLTAMFISTIWGEWLFGPVLAIGCASAPWFARLTYTLASGVSGRDYVRAARILGVGRWTIVRRHVLPNVAEPLIVNAAAAAGGMLLSLSVLSFLGIGLQPPHLDWGRLFNEGMTRAYVDPMSALGPGLAIVAACLAFNVLGEAMAAAAGLRSQAGGRARWRSFRAAARRSSGAPASSGTGTGTGAAASLGADPVRSRTRTAPDPGEQVEPVLDVQNLSVAFPASETPVVQDVSFAIRPGEVVGIVGESGSGKSVTALACAGLSNPNALVAADRLDFDGRPVPAADARLSRAEKRRLGTTMALVFQDPTTSLNPALRVGTQLAEVAEVHLGESKRVAWSRAVDRLEQVLIDSPQVRSKQYPQQLSGGMRQRVGIGMAMMGSPRLIIADEPTTALDVTVQRQVIALLDRARRDTGAAVVLISHDIALVSGFCDRVLVMYHGRLVEDLPTDTMLTAAKHPYTQALLSCIPDLQTDKSTPLPTVADLMDTDAEPADAVPSETHSAVLG